MTVREGGATDPPERLRRLVVTTEASFRRAFLEALQGLIDATTFDRLVDLINAGRLMEALDVLDAAAATFAATYGTAVNTAGAATAAWLSSEALDVVVRFDVANDRVIAINRRNQLRLITEFAETQRDAVREALISGNQTGVNPRDQARAFRDSIGLTRRQTRAVGNFRRLLSAGPGGAPDGEALSRALRDGRFDRTIQRAIREGKPLSSAQIDRMVDRYRARYIKYRSEVIARTEALRSVHQGTEEMYRQAIDRGVVQPEQLVRVWNTAQDSRVRDAHGPMHGQVADADGMWTSGNGNRLAYPGDGPASESIQCRCAISTRIVG